MVGGRGEPVRASPCAFVPRNCGRAAVGQDELGAGGRAGERGHIETGSALHGRDAARQPRSIAAQCAAGLGHLAGVDSQPMTHLIHAGNLRWIVAGVGVALLAIVFAQIGPGQIRALLKRMWLVPRAAPDGSDT